MMRQIKISGLDVWMEHGVDMPVACPLGVNGGRCTASCAWFSMEGQRWGNATSKVAKCGPDIIGEIIKED